MSKCNGENRKQDDQCCGRPKMDLSSKKAQLTPMEFRVTQERHTERPYSNKYNKHWETGSYHCIVCETELFRSNTKFESKSGWPAFSNVVDAKRVKLTPDLSHIGANLLLLVARPDLARTEVSCSNCNAHLGHLFKDGPRPTGLRYCINSSSLNFISGDSISSTTNNGDIDRNSPVELLNGKIKANGTESHDDPTKTIQMNGSNAPPMAMLCLNNQSSKSSSCQKNKSNHFVRGSSRYASSGSAGASLTAARISFFQQQAAQHQQQNPPSSRIFGSARNGNLSNRFVGSTSSGSLSSNTNTNVTTNGGSIRRRNSAGLFPNLAKIDQVSSSPKIVVLRETSL